MVRGLPVQPVQDGNGRWFWLVVGGAHYGAWMDAPGLNACSPLQHREEFVEEPYVPAGVEACRSGSWHLHLVSKETGEVRDVPFKCGSWRCPECARARGWMDASRILEALKRKGGIWSYLVLTCPGTEWRDIVSPKESYRRLVGMWKGLAQSMRRAWGRFEYASIVEQQQDGYPHLNVVLGGMVAEEVNRGRGPAIRQVVRRMSAGKAQSNQVPREFRPACLLADVPSLDPRCS